MIKKSGWFFFFLLITASCLDEPECFSLNNNILGVRFRRMTGRQADTVFITRISALGTDSIFAENSGLTGIDVPLNFYEDTTDFLVEAAAGTYDLRLVYESQPQFVSEECGERYVLSGLRAISETFDSIRLVSDRPKRNLQTGSTIEIFKCPAVSNLILKLTTSLTIVSIEASSGQGVIRFSKGAATHAIVPLDVNQSSATIRITLTNASNTQSIQEFSVSYDKTPRTLFSTCGEQVIVHDIQLLSGTATVVNDSIQDNGAPNIAITL